MREKISEMIIHATLVRSALEAAIANCEITSDGSAFPNELYTNAGKYHGAANYSLMVRHLHDIGGARFSPRLRYRISRARRPARCCVST